MAANGTKTTRVAPSLRDRACELQRQACLANASWPDERDQACGGIGEPRRSVCRSSSRPSRTVIGTGSETLGQFIDSRGLSRCARAFKERVTGRTRQVKSRRQGTHGFDVGPAAFATLQRAHGMNRQAGNCRELFLRESRRLAEGLELRAK